MTFEAFKILVERDIKNYLPDEYKNCEISKTQIVKTNDTVLDGLVFQMTDRSLAPTIYLNYQYTLLESGTPYLDCLKNISSDVVRAMKQAEKGKEMQMDASQFMDEKKLYVQAVNVDENREFLKNVPYKIENDLAYVLRYGISMEGGNASVVLNNKLLKMSQKKFDELFEIAQENMQKDIYIKSLTNQVEDMLFAKNSPDEIEKIESANDLYVLSNTGKYHGAGIVANKEILKKVAEQMGCDFTILPSSIHEIIIVPDKYAELANISKKDLCKMVQEVNDTTLKQEEKLSDNIYHFDSKEKKIEMIENPYIEKNKKLEQRRLRK